MFLLTSFTPDDSDECRTHVPDSGRNQRKDGRSRRSCRSRSAAFRNGAPQPERTGERRQTEVSTNGYLYQIIAKRSRRRRREVRSYLVCACCTAALANRGLGERESSARQGRVAVTARDIPIVLVGWRGQVR